MKDKKYYIFTLNMKLLNIFSFIILFLIVGLTYIIDKNFLINALYYTFATKRLLLTYILIILYLMLHELLHSIGYYLYGAKYKNIVYGIELEKGIFYCLCKQNVSKKNILNSIMFPLFYIGIVTYIISIITNNYYLLILSLFNISGCVGDIFTFIFISRLDKDTMFSEYDDTTSFGLYSNKDLSKEKPFGLKYVETKDKLVRKELTKIKVSKISYIILIAILILGFITLWM